MELVTVIILTLVLIILFFFAGFFRCLDKMTDDPVIRDQIAHSPEFKQLKSLVFALFGDKWYQDWQSK